MLTQELKLQIIESILVYHCQKGYDYEEIFINSGDYDNTRKDPVVEDFMGEAWDIVVDKGRNGLEIFKSSII